MKINKPAILIPPKKWYDYNHDGSGGLDEKGIYDITYVDFGKEVTNRVTNIGYDGNDDDDWWINCSILGRDNGGDWNEEDHPQIMKSQIIKIIKIK